MSWLLTGQLTDKQTCGQWRTGRLKANFLKSYDCYTIFIVVIFCENSQKQATSLFSAKIFMTELLPVIIFHENSQKQATDIHPNINPNRII